MHKNMMFSNKHKNMKPLTTHIVNDLHLNKKKSSFQHLICSVLFGNNSKKLLVLVFGPRSFTVVVHSHCSHGKTTFLVPEQLITVSSIKSEYVRSELSIGHGKSHRQ